MTLSPIFLHTFFAILSINGIVFIIMSLGANSKIYMNTEYSIVNGQLVINNVNLIEMLPFYGFGFAGMTVLLYVVYTTFNRIVVINNNDRHKLNSLGDV